LHDTANADDTTGININNTCMTHADDTTGIIINITCMTLADTTGIIINITSITLLMLMTPFAPSSTSLA